MKTRGIILFSLILLFIKGCDLGESYLTEPIIEDYNYISDPRARWKAYNLTDYVYTIEMDCYCPEPWEIEVIVRKSTPNSVRYKLFGNYSYQEKEEIYNRTLADAKTIEQIFDYVEKESKKADAFSIEYDRRFGFPYNYYFRYESFWGVEETHCRIYNFNKIAN